MKESVDNENILKQALFAVCIQVAIWIIPIWILFNNIGYIFGGPLGAGGVVPSFDGLGFGLAVIFIFPFAIFFHWLLTKLYYKRYECELFTVVIFSIAPIFVFILGLISSMTNEETISGLIAIEGLISLVFTISHYSVLKQRMIDNIKNVLLVIDLQKQFKDSNGQYEKCLKYIEDHRDDYYIIGTIFQNTQGSMYEKHLDWHDCIGADKSDLEYSVDDVIIKNSYSVDVDELFNKLNEPGVHIDLIGCDADACVLATVFALWDRGKDFSILSDYIYTTAEDFTKYDVLKIMKRNFGDCLK